MALLAPSIGVAQSADRVDLVGGGFLRGTVIEHIPGDHVTIELATGEVRVLSASSVERVATNDAPDDLAPETEAGPVVAVRVTSNHPGLTLHRVARWIGRAPEMERLCAIPCTASLTEGRQSLAYANDVGRPVRLPHEVSIRSGLTLHLEYIDRGTEQAIGWMVLVGAVVSSAALITVGALAYGLDEGLIVTGAIIGLVGPVLAGLRSHLDLVVREDGVAF